MWRSDVFLQEPSLFPLHVARLDGMCLLSTAPSREPCFKLWSADAHCTHLYIHCELTILWLYIVWLLKVSDALPLTLCGLSSLKAIAYMVDLLWSFFICLTNSAIMGKVLQHMFLNAILPMSGFHLMGLGHLHLLYILNVWSPTIYISPGHLAIIFFYFVFYLLCFSGVQLTL